jgi:protein SCO1/2
MGPKNFIVAIILAIALAAGIFVAARLQAPAALKAAFVLPAPMPLPEFALVDQDGDGFTHCPDICPTTLQILAAARSELAAAGEEPLPRIVLVSVDPERDTPTLIGKYVDYFGDDNLGITGDLDELRKLTSGLGIYFEKQPGDGSDYSVDHSVAVLLIDPNGEFHALFGGPHSIENYVHDIPLIMANQ